MPLNQDGQIKAMVTLLADYDERTVELVRRSLMGMGEEAIPTLLRATEIGDTVVRRRLESILDDIQFRQVERSFSDWAAGSSEDSDLEEGAFLMARVACPGLDIEIYRKRLDGMAQSLRDTVQRLKNPRFVIQALNQYLFDKEQFRGNIENYYDPNNSYLNQVLDRRIGIPISLSVVYLLLARRLGLPVTGVGLPGHFILKYESADFTAYLDPFNEGQILSREDCLRFLSNSGYGDNENHLASVSNRNIILRMIRNLIYIYTQIKDDDMVERFNQLSRILGPPIPF
jgi:regulator of sirC expression with transglutaminase-like and TPR domain